MKGIINYIQNKVQKTIGVIDAYLSDVPVEDKETSDWGLLLFICGLFLAFVVWLFFLVAVVILVIYALVVLSPV